MFIFSIMQKWSNLKILQNITFDITLNFWLCYKIFFIEKNL